MKKKELISKTNIAMSDTKVALQTMYDALNQGQKKKAIKDEKVLAHFKRYGVEYSDSE